jgi:protein phosphatase
MVVDLKHRTASAVGRVDVSLSIAAPLGRSAQRFHIEFVGCTDRGLRRDVNEDAFAAWPDLGIFVVADGMGGAAAGEVASRLAVDAMRTVFDDAAIPGRKERGPTGLAHGLALLGAGVDRANEQVHAAAEADRAKAGMGTTLTALLVRPSGVALAHVGDSRACRLRRGRLQQLTEDHSLVSEQIRAGLISADRAKASPHRHIITRAVGTAPTVQVDKRLADIEPGDTFLLASDGLHGVLGDDDIAAILRLEPELPRAAALLLAATHAAGAPDNVTVVLVRIPEDVPGTDVRGRGHGHG